MNSPGDEVASRDDLPDSVMGIHEAIGDHNPVELEHLANRMPRTVPLPEGDYSPGVAKRMKNLAQYKGRSLEGNRRSMANLRREVKVSTPEKAPTTPETLPQPKPVLRKPPSVPGVKLARGKFLRACLSRDEYDLYVETWNEWWKAHVEEYDQPEDVVDVHTVCMETVVQFRLALLQREHPRRYNATDYNQSQRRMQQARENLAARRTSRISEKSNSNSTTHNVILAIGQAGSRQVVNEREHQAEIDDSLNMKFLQKTEESVSVEELMKRHGIAIENEGKGEDEDASGTNAEDL